MGTFARLSLLSLTISSLENRDVREGIDAAPAYPSTCQLAPPASAQNTATFRRSHWSFIQYSRKPVLHLFFSRWYPFLLNTHPHFLSPHILPCFYMPQTHYSSHGRQGRPHSPIRVHPPFPSFAWVMTTQANPPTDAYAYGYVQNAHTQSLPLTQRRTHLPGSCVAHHECYQSNHRTAKPFIPPPPPPSAEVSSIATHEMFMVGPLFFFVFFFSTDVFFFKQRVDCRYHDPPTRPFVPWRASLASYEMQRLRSPVPAVPAAASPRAKRRRGLDVRFYHALRRVCGLSKDVKPRP